MTRETQHMAPDASPVAVTKKAGVRRVNNLPLIIVGTVAVAFVIMMMLVASNRSKQQNMPAETKKENAGNTTMFANEIASDQNTPVDALVPPAPPETPISPHGEGILIATPDDLNTPPLPPGSRNLNPPPLQNDEEIRIKTAKFQQFEEAVKSKTGVPVTAPRSAAQSTSSPTGSPASRDEMLARLSAVKQQIDQAQRDDPTAAYQARLNQIRGMNSTGGDSASSSKAPQLLQSSSASASRNSIAQFQSKDGDRWRLDSEPEVPRSPFELRAGFVVPATLISGINSDLPGQIMAQVSQSVYDTPTGQHLLIPQGARLVGSYSSDVAYGQARVLIAWQRIVFPDGKAMDIGAMPGADGAGYAGFKDQVNNHYLRVFGSAFLMSGVTAGITLSQGSKPANLGDRQRASDALSEALGQQLGQVTAQLIAKNMNIAPTLEIRPGYRFNIIVTKDMTFSKPYQSFDY